MKILIFEQDEKTLENLGYVFDNNEITLVLNEDDFIRALFICKYDKILVNIDYCGSIIETVKLLGVSNVVYTTAHVIDFGVAPVLYKPYGVEQIEELIYS